MCMYGHEICNFIIVQLRSISNYITYTVVPRASTHLYVSVHPHIVVLKGKCQFPVQAPTTIPPS